MTGHIYLIRDGAHLDKQIYKVGMTRDFNTRLSQYSKGTETIGKWSVDEKYLKHIEELILVEFSGKYKIARGKEWFEGDCESMKEDIETIVDILGVKVEVDESQDATTYECRRCDYECGTKGCMLQHLRRKKPCEVTKENITIDECISDLTHREYNKHTWCCRYCNRKFNTYQSRWRHMKTCKSIPEKESLENQIQILTKRIEKLEKNRDFENPRP